MSAQLQVESPRLERYRCGTCAYGISVARAPSRCPMCGGRSWRPELAVRPPSGAIAATGTRRPALL
jgi:hypothetical protein